MNKTKTPYVAVWGFLLIIIIVCSKSLQECEVH